MTGVIHKLPEECISGRSSRIYEIGFSDRDFVWEFKCVSIYFIKLEQNVP